MMRVLTPPIRTTSTCATLLIHSVSHGVPAALREVIILGRTLKKRAVDVLAYFDRPGTSNGPTEATTARSACSSKARPRRPASCKGRATLTACLARRNRARSDRGSVGGP